MPKLTVLLPERGLQQHLAGQPGQLFGQTFGDDRQAFGPTPNAVP